MTRLASMVSSSARLARLPPRQCSWRFVESSCDGAGRSSRPLGGPPLTCPAGLDSDLVLLRLRPGSGREETPLDLGSIVGLRRAASSQETARANCFACASH